MKKNRHYTIHYYNAHQSRLDSYIIPEFGDYLISAINDVMIEDWVITLSSCKNYQEELADDSKNKVLICFRIILQEAVRQRIIAKNPAKDISLITVRSKSRAPFTDIESFISIKKSLGRQHNFGQFVRHCCLLGFLQRSNISKLLTYMSLFTGDIPIPGASGMVTKPPSYR
jgi:hypothetical protein